MKLRSLTLGVNLATVDSHVLNTNK